MSETRSTDTPSKAGAPRWMKVLLVLSLAANLLIAGAIVGAVSTGAGKWRGPPGGGPGALVQALSEDDRRQLKRRMAREFMGERESRGIYRETMRGLIEQLRAPEFDAEAVSERMMALRGHFQARLGTAQSVLVEHLENMSPEDRASYANRLEIELQRKKR